eukprot:gene7465-7675_t
MSQIVIVKLVDLTGWSYGQSMACPTVCSRIDPSSPQHGACVDEAGVLQYFHINHVSRNTQALFRYQLHYKPENDATLEPISKPWTFQFVPGLPGEVMLVQSGSCRILYASLPRQDDVASDVFLFGSHTSPVTSFITNGSIALSGCANGIVKIWRMADGQLANEAAEPAEVAITDMTFVNSCLVAAGTSAGSVVLYDIAAGMLLAVQRFMAGSGPVNSLVSWSSQQLLSSCDLATVVQDTVVPKSSTGKHVKAADVDPVFDAAAVAQVGVQAGLPGAQSWQLLHRINSLAAPVIALAFAAAGDLLAVASSCAQVLGTDAIAVAAAGGSPGAVSLYRIASGAVVELAAKGGVDLPTGSSRMQQQQQQSLQLCHQWSLRSLPISIHLLQSSHLDLLADSKLVPTQVLDLLVTPAFGPPLILRSPQPLLAIDPRQQRISAAAEAGRPVGPPESNGTLNGAGDGDVFPQGLSLQAGRSGRSLPGIDTAAAFGSAFKDSDDFMLNVAERDWPELGDNPASPAGGAVAAGVIKPTTLPSLRSWTDRGSAIAAEVAASTPAVPVDLHALAAEMKEVQDRQWTSTKPSGVAAEGLEGTAVLQLAAKLADLDVAPDEQLYCDLTDLKDISTPTRAHKLVPKQLDARWLASRNYRPEVGTLFKPEEWQQGDVQPQVLVLPWWPTPQQVVQQLLWP